jgi:hypothetical protein
MITPGLLFRKLLTESFQPGSVSGRQLVEGTCQSSCLQIDPPNWL